MYGPENMSKFLQENRYEFCISRLKSTAFEGASNARNSLRRCCKSVKLVPKDEGQGWGSVALWIGLFAQFESFHCVICLAEPWDFVLCSEFGTKRILRLHSTVNWALFAGDTKKQKLAMILESNCLFYLLQYKRKRSGISSLFLPLLKTVFLIHFLARSTVSFPHYTCSTLEPFSPPSSVSVPGIWDWSRPNWRREKQNYKLLYTTPIWPFIS